MSVKRYKLPVSTSVYRIRKARAKLKKMTMARKIELMVEAGLLTESQAKTAMQKLAETTASTVVSDGSIPNNPI